MAVLDKEKILNIVKFRNGVFYSNELIDNDFQTMIDECKEYILNAGVTQGQLDSSPLAITAYCLWCKILRSQTPQELTTNPTLISCICQIRNKPEVKPIE